MVRPQKETIGELQTTFPCKSAIYQGSLVGSLAVQRDPGPARPGSQAKPPSNANLVELLEPASLKQGPPQANQPGFLSPRHQMLVRW